MENILLKHGLIFSKVKGINIYIYGDVLIKNGIIVKIGQKISETSVSRIINCNGKYITSGLIDMHVHFRTPGQEHKETLTTGSMAALAGGFTSVVCMANTVPVIDNTDKLHQLLIRAENESLVNLHQVSAVTKNLDGLELVDFKKMRDSGAIGFSDDGKAIQNPDLLIEVMIACADTGKPLLLHCQDDRFDTYDKRAEYYYVSLVLKILELLKVPVHIQHISCAESVQLIREAKAKGTRVTCETAPHYIALTRKDYSRIGSNAKMNPPLRSEVDRQAVIRGLIDGTIDVIATDHAPHTEEEKKSDNPPFGIIGLETAVPVILTTLSKRMHVASIISKVTSNPAKILGFKDKGYLKIGLPADITIIDPKIRKVVDPEKFYSKARNCPWAGKRLQGWPVMVIKNGRIIMEEGRIII